MIKLKDNTIFCREYDALVTRNMRGKLILRGRVQKRKFDWTIRYKWAKWAKNILQPEPMDINESPVESATSESLTESDTESPVMSVDVSADVSVDVSADVSVDVSADVSVDVSAAEDEN